MLGGFITFDPSKSHSMNTLRFLPTLLVTALIFVFSSCKKDEETPTPTPTTPEPKKLIFSFAFDPTQERLNSTGNPSTVPAGRAAQNPQFNGISAHYIELTPTAFTQLGDGEVLYAGAQTTAGGESAIDFAQSTIVGEGEVFKSFNLSGIAPGTYNYVRVSLAYQNYDVNVRYSGVDLVGTIASFIGFNTYITNYDINTQNVVVNGNRLQGYWAFETSYLGAVYNTTGQAPPGATTVPNPLFLTSEVPAGSCVVTGQFDPPLVITGNETADVNVTLSLSTNQSFEWTEVNADGLYEPAAGEAVVDMGVRGLLPLVNQ